MKLSTLFYLILFFNAPLVVTAQKIQYSRGIIKPIDKTSIQLLAGVNGYHHLVQFLPDRKPQIFLFNKNLNLESTIQLNIPIYKNTEVKIIQFENEYWLYTHITKSSTHQLFKVNGNGIITDHSDLLKNTADSFWNKTTSPLNLSKIGNNLFVIINRYFDNSKTVKLSLIKIEAEKKASIQHEISIPLNIENESLHDIALFKNKLFVLKTGKDPKGNNVLYVLKSDINKNQSYYTQFESGQYLFQNPSFRFNNTDSSVFLYAMMIPPYGFKEAKPSLFIARLNESLNELVPVKILKDVLPETAASSFILEKENSAGWICFSQNQYEYSNYSSGYFRSSNTSNNLSNLNTASPYATAYSSNLPAPVVGQTYAKEIAISLLNNRLDKTYDSLISNKGRSIKTDPYAYASFVLDNQPYLLLTQKLNKKSKALVLIKPNDYNTLQTIPIRSYDRYEYLLSLLQIVTDNSFVIPFTTKKEIGLMKVTLTN